MLPARGTRRLRWAAAAAALVACFVLQALRHVHGQDPTYDERTYFGLGAGLLRGGGWEGPALLHPPLSFYVAALPILSSPTPPGPDDAPALWRCRLVSLLVFTPPLLLAVALWARALYGRAAGLIALALAAFSPTLLAHGPLITPDAALTATGFIAVFLYWRDPQRRPWAWGLLLGLALLSKAAALLFVAVIAGLALARGRASGWAPHLRALAAGALVAWLVLCAGYGFRGLLDWRAKAELLARARPGPVARTLALSAVPFVPLPYFNTLGRQARVAAGPWPSYLLGEVSPTGWRHYFVVALGVKETLPFLLLLLAALLALRRLPPRRGELALLAAPALFLAVMSLSRVQIGVRYLLPALPFLYVFASRLALAAARAPRTAAAALAAALGWHAASTTAAGPDFLAYFNELAGGPSGGYRVLGDSNLDWGQNRSAARRWALEHGALFEPLELPAAGQVVLSTNRVQGILAGRARYRLLRDEYAPVARVGWNWFVYDMERRRVPPESVVPVLSGERWLSGPARDNWPEPAFDERSWTPAAVLASEAGFTAGEAYPGTEAALVTCGQGRDDCAMRSTFTLGAPAERAILYLAARGAYALYANGALAARGAACAGGGLQEREVRLERHWRPGGNVLALRVTGCGAGAGPLVFAEMRVVQRRP